LIYPLIEEWHEEFDYRVVMMCAAFGVSKSVYCAWLKRPLSQRKQNRVELVAKKRAIYEESDGVYCAPKITKTLQEQGVKSHQKQVSRLMKKHGIRSITVRKYKQTTNFKN
jgi:putative transposase